MNNLLFAKTHTSLPMFPMANFVLGATEPDRLPLKSNLA